MTITLPDEMREALESEARHAGAESVDEYVRHMYERAKRQASADERARGLVALAEEGLASPPLSEMEQTAFLDRLRVAS